jgi:hypothetical protein
MSNALVPVADIERMANAVAKSGLFGIKTAEQGVALMLIAQAEGLHPAIAARDYHVIQGRPALKTDAMMARFQQAGGKVEWKVYTDDEVTGVFSHPQGGSLTVTWTLAQAKRIGLAGKDNWRNYPRAMLRARCISEGIRSVYPASVVGVYTPEEVQDFDAPAQPPSIKDMGQVEVVPAVNATGDYKLFVPWMQEEYSTSHDLQDWKETYLGVVKKIVASPKGTPEAKRERVQGMWLSNEPMLEKMTALERAEFRAEVVRAGGTAEAPKEQPPAENELSLTESSID